MNANKIKDGNPEMFEMLVGAVKLAMNSAKTSGLVAEICREFNEDEAAALVTLIMGNMGAVQHSAPSVMFDAMHDTILSGITAATCQSFLYGQTTAIELNLNKDA